MSYENITDLKLLLENKIKEISSKDNHLLIRNVTLTSEYSYDKKKILLINIYYQENSYISHKILINYTDSIREIINNKTNNKWKDYIPFVYLINCKDNFE